MKKEKSSKKKLPIIIIVIICLLAVIFAVIKLTGNNNDTGNETSAEETTITDEITDLSSDGTTEVTEVEETTEVTEKDETSTLSASEQESKADDETTAAKKSTAEIVEIYNTSANKIKANAKSITRNYSKMQSLPEYLELPSAIESLGSWAINKFVKGSDEPVTFETKDDIKANFPVGGESYTSHLTEDMVKSASLKDTGKTYEITINLYDDKIESPKKGTGYAGVFNTVSASTFEDINVPGTKFESVKIKGINGKIVCTVDKASGNIAKIIFTNTDVLDLGVKVAGSNLTVKFALACENSYSIKY